MLYCEDQQNLVLTLIPLCFIAEAFLNLSINITFIEKILENLNLSVQTLGQPMQYATPVI
jgi:hypothetical protein